MNNNLIRAVFLAALLFSAAQSAFALDTLSSKFPRAVLVQLRSEHNRIEAISAHGTHKQLEEVQKDAVGERTAMINDFKRNFKYCPVYYYMDTNADRIKNKEFDGVLLDSNGVPATHLVINNKTVDYVIAYYGYMLSQPRSKKVLTNDSEYIYDPQSPYGKGLVILNDQFQQLTYYYKLGYDDFLHGLKKIRPMVYYQSKHFDIDYYPFVKLFNINLTDRPGAGQFIDDYMMYKKDVDRFDIWKFLFGKKIN